MSAEPVSRGHLYTSLKKRFSFAGISTPELDARLLLSAACGVDDVGLIAAPDVVVSKDAMTKLEGMVARRIAGEPVSRILGVREFWGLEFALNRGTLDPRPESETIIEAVLKARPDVAAPLRFLDLGTGTGCLLLALVSEYANALGVGVDVSDDAIKAAMRNASLLGFADRVQFMVNDWARGLDGPFDVIVSNPPYIPSADINALAREVKQFDPVAALDGGDDGLDPYRHLMPELPRLLSPAGMAIFEFGKGQGADVARIAIEAGLKVERVICDLAGLERTIIVKL
ncbi:MAG: peptide chain release factor N(5)-glutamine methyltransferase [Parvibaculum sp.]